MNTAKIKNIVFFDGYCHLCQALVQWILARDSDKVFYFAPLDSLTAKKYLQDHPTLQKGNSVVLWQLGKAYHRSQAALKIVGNLKFPWPLLQIFYLIPTFLRDWLYDCLARKRYDYFGKSTQCFLPQAPWQKRFLN